MFIYQTICYVIAFSRYGCASVMISDQGREFVNKVNEEFMTPADRRLGEVLSNYRLQHFTP